jgi:hypothetical protein
LWHDNHSGSGHHGVVTTILPTDADMSRYQQRGLWVSRKVIPEDLLNGAERGMARFYAGERDAAGYESVESDGGQREHGDVLRKNDASLA